MIKLNNKGQTLIEALVALGVSSIIIGAVVMAVITGLNNATFSKNQNLATGFAQQGMDILLQQSQSDWTAFTAVPTGKHCLDQDATGISGLAVSSCSAVNITSGKSSFKREVNIAISGSGCLAGERKVSVTVSWADGKCTDSATPFCHNVILDSCFSNINTSTNP